MAKSLRYQEVKMALLSMPMFRIQGVTRTTSSAPETQGDDTDIAITTVLSKEGRFEETQHVFNSMYPPQNSSVAAAAAAYHSLLQSCLNNAKSSLPEAKLVHAHMIQMHFQCQDISLTNKLVTVYAKFGCLANARRVFDQMPDRDVVSWTAMISAYARDGYADKALKMFDEMKQTGVQPNHFTFSSVLPACATLASLEQGREIHEEISTSGCLSEVFVGNALVDMYAKCGSIEEARHVFDKMPQRDVVSWNAMISGYALNGQIEKALELFQNIPKRNVVSWTSMITGYAQNGLAVEALKLFQQMQRAGVKPISNTFASVLSACANLAALEYGKAVHEYVIKIGFESDTFVGNALVDMYAKCGSIEVAQNVFDKMPAPDIVSWNAIIVGYAMHGFGKEALQLFEKMEHTSMQPNHVTFVGVLSACCHAGLLDHGWRYFNRMSQFYCITPAVEHYCCMADLLGRSGQLYEAYDLISKMPIKPTAAVWASLLGACRIHSNIELGERVADCLFHSDSKNAGHFVLLSNIYAAAGRWDDVEKVRKMMKERSVVKKPGCSWIEVNNKMYAFLVGDRSHPQTQKIYAELDRLSGQMKEAGYVPDKDFALHDVEEEQKEHILGYHSEKLAVVFGLMNISPEIPIRVIKNLRVCGDCHSAIKFISKIAAREIVVRDGIRFHHFSNGQCSCGDYW